jgi:chitodextrinase
MSFPGTYNINYYYGDTLEFRVFPKNSSGEPFNLATFGNAKFTIARNRNTPVEDHISCFAQIDPDQTNILCAIRPEDSEKLIANADGSFPAYVYDVEISKPVNGSPYPIVYTLLNGSVTTTRDVTRPGSGAVDPPVISIPLNPTNLTLESATTTTLSVSWTAPATGDAPTLYNVAVTPFTESLISLRQALENSNLSTASTAFTFTGLDVETGYSVIVRATNSAGDASIDTILFNTTAFETLAAPLTVPAAPTINSINELDSSLQVLFTASSDGGSDIINYKYSIDGTSYLEFDPAQTSSPLTISGLTNGDSYPVTIKAVNSVGDSEASNSITGTPTADVTVPSAPTINSIDSSDSSLIVNFTPGGDGGSAITNYKYSIDGTNYIAFDPATTTSPVTITGLTNDTEYSVTIKAVNAIGDSDSSNSVSGTPVAPVTPPEPDFVVTSSGTSAYIINGVSNETLTLVRGETYIFDINASGHPFFIQTVPGAYSSENVYNDGITGNGTQVGTLTWEVSLSAPDTLYYVCQFHSSMQGVINIIDGDSGQYDEYDEVS